MKITKDIILISVIAVSLFRFFIFPIDDYPDIFDIYTKMIESKAFFSIANIFDLNELFLRYSCMVVKPESKILNYLLGGGFYKCNGFPLSINYTYYFLFITILFLIFILFFYKLKDRLSPFNKLIYKKIIFNFILFPSTAFFLLSLHIDIPYHFLIISFVFLSFVLSFTNQIKWVYPIFLLPFIFVRLLAPDNQAIIFIGLTATSIFSLLMSKNKIIIELFDKVADQFSYILRLRFKISKKVFFYFFLFLFTLIFLIIFFRFEFLGFLANPYFVDLGEISKIASDYSNEDYVSQYELLFKYPIHYRIFGAIQGLIITSPFGIKPSIITTFLFFLSFFIGFIKLFSIKSRYFPVFIKIFFISSVILMILILSIFPFFSYVKYWLFLLPFASLFLCFTPRLTSISFILIYAELILKSSWFSLG